MQKVVSGGQTGVDRAALDIALKRGIPCGGWCPKGRKAGDGPIDPKYPLKETPTADYLERTSWNVRDSDGTLVLFWGQPSGGTAYTLACAQKWKKPSLKFDLTKRWSQENKRIFDHWIEKQRISVLNVAGPRESHKSGKVYRKAKAYLGRLLQEPTGE